MHATTRAALVAGPALFLAGGAVASVTLRVRGGAAALTQALPAELLPFSDRIAVFAILLATIALASLAARIAVREAEHIPRSALAMTAAASLLATFAWPVVFSSDVHAYAAYGIVLLHGGNPYAGALHASADAALRSHLDAWSGSIPRDVYGPLFTAVAALAAATLQPVAALRIAAVAAYAGCVLVWRRGDARGAAHFATHPVVAWAAIEGHNDAFALVPVLLAFDRARRHRIAALAVGLAVKAFAAIPLAFVLAPRRLRSGTAVAALVLALWALLPHPYAWYATWLVAVAWHATPSPARIGLQAAAYCGLAAYLPEVWFGPHPATFHDDPAFMGSLLMIQYAIPLAAILAATALLRPFAAFAQNAPPSPPPLAAPAATSAPLPATQPVPSPAGTSTPTSAPAGTPTPAPAATANPYAYVVTPGAPAAGVPAITEIAMTDRIVHSGGTFAARITTGTDVNAVFLEAYGQRLATAPAGPGRFLFANQVPNVPSYLLNRSYTVNVIATTADGRQNTVPISVRVER